MGGQTKKKPSVGGYGYFLEPHNAQKSVLELIDTFELDDVYRDQEPAGRSYTWSAYSNLKQARLDYFLVFTDLTDH